MMISYAQNFEDVLLNRLFPADHRGFYVDVGANDPSRGSVTAHFYGRGWRGINVEPSCTFQQVADARPRDVNLKLALSSRSGTEVFYEFPEAPALSSFDPALAKSAAAKFGFCCNQRTVEVSTLAHVCHDHARQPIDFLSIDVEGHEREVLIGADFRNYRPRVVIVEATRPVSGEPTHEGWEDILFSADYLFAFFDGLNRYYVRGEEPQLIGKLAVPANVFDDFITFREQCNLDAIRAMSSRLAATDQLGRFSLAIARRMGRIETTVSSLWRRFRKWST